MLKKYMFICFLLGIFISPLTFGSVVPFNVTFLEIGNDVKVTMSLRDLAAGTFLDPPSGFWIKLWEDDLIFDDLLGGFGKLYSDLSITALAGGGYESASFMHTFTNASNAFTGFGNDYFVTVEAVPVPAAVWLFGSGLLGLIGIARRKKAT